MFLVIHEFKPPEKPIQIRCVGRTFATYAEADKCAAQFVKDFKVRAWIYEVDEPPMVELVAENDQFQIVAEH